MAKEFSADQSQVTRVPTGPRAARHHGQTAGQIVLVHHTAPADVLHPDYPAAAKFRNPLPRPAPQRKIYSAAPRPYHLTVAIRELAMPLPFAPLIPIALRIGAIAAAGLALRRALRGEIHRGHSDQRAEDALDALDEGIALHQPRDRAGDGGSQTNAGMRWRRVIRWGSTALEVDATLISRFRVRRV